VKAFLLAAGKGTRLRPLTDSIPKCLVPIRETVLLEIWLELFARSGISEVLINLHSHADAVRSFVAKRDFGVRIRWFDEPLLLGSAGTLAANHKWVESDPYFWVFYADVLTNLKLSGMLQAHLEMKLAATLGVYRVPNPSECGILEIDDGSIVRSFEEKPREPKSDFAFSGVMIGTPEFLRQIPSTVPADIGFHVLPKLSGRMRAYFSDEYLIDIGTWERYQTAQRTWPGLYRDGILWNKIPRR
jgi:mannose-1-phosphate guanylyltransferase